MDDKPGVSTPATGQQTKTPYVSLVIPVYNEEENLMALHQRINQVMRDYGRDYEVIFVDDGSADASWSLLNEIFQLDREHAVIVQLNRNYGQHLAIMAGFEKTRGQIIVTLDADLQNPPEDIPKLVAKIEEGYDTVGGWRGNRQDSWLRTLPSHLVNRIMGASIGGEIRDSGCMLRAYRREIIDQINRCPEATSFIPALANSFAGRITEIEVGHRAREKGQSKYNLFRLIQLNFDLMTGFSSIPIQAVSWVGVIIAILGLAFAGFLFLRRLIIGPEVEGIFTLFAILFFFVGIQILALGMVGEYVGRIYREVRGRPKYVIRQMLRQNRSDRGTCD
ncbi:MAG: glycosyltransferase [Deltaproteobacteria bacterium]|nr:glycosyltransferase [Deltaproteobacteria bacterium]